MEELNLLQAVAGVLVAVLGWIMGIVVKRQAELVERVSRLEGQLQELLRRHD